MRLKNKKGFPLIDPDEIFLDSRNLPLFNTQQLEGQLEKPITKQNLYFLAGVFLLGLIIFLGKIYQLQISQGEAFAERSEQNTLRHTPIFPQRGVIYDRYGVELAWNNPKERVYREEAGISHVVGYLGYSSELNASSSNYNPRELIGRDGVERMWNETLRGQTGVRIEEINVRNEIQSEYLLQLPRAGENLMLSIDVKLQEKLYDAVKTLAQERGFSGGAGVLLDIKTGELLSLVSYPEYDQKNVAQFLTDPNKPFLNRAVAGLYAPGSIIKPIIAIGALTEKIIDPATKILSTGVLTLPNPFLPDQPSLFRDWKAHGLVNLRQALAVSSDVYFYEIGGGFENQPGLGIAKIDKYARLFGLGETTGINWPSEEVGNIPTPEWKKANFPKDQIWRIGNTYHTAIGQYGFQVTPLQMARVAGAIATGGALVAPTILVASTTPIQQPARDISPVISSETFQIVREGMRLAVTEGTAQALNVSSVAIAAKTGTAELGATKDFVNSWAIGFFPYETPRYAFAVIMERGRVGAISGVGGASVMREFIDWLTINAPEYLR
ncbi:MAG: penicillin-binding transpeptidase domain-containing protein [Candidatus Vogelbacteria bacterium]